MAEPEEDEDEFDVDEAVPAKGGGGRKKLILVMAGVMILLVLAGGAGLFLSGALDSMLGIEEADKKVDPDAALTATVYWEMPSMTVDLKSGQCRAPFLKLTLQLAVTDQQDVALLEEAKPLIIDRVQGHLRSLERQDLVGREGAERLRYDVATIVDAAARPVKVRAVLFKEFLLQ